MEMMFDGKKYELEDDATHILISRPVEIKGGRKLERRINVYTKKGLVIIKLTDRMYNKLKSQISMNIKMDKGDYSDLDRRKRR